MCIVCASRPNAGLLAKYDQHRGSYLGSGLDGGFGSGGANAPYTWDQISNYLKDGYWNSNSETWRRFDFSSDPTMTVTYNSAFLSTQAKAIAEFALDSWASVTGINFVNVGAAPATLNETVDAPGSITSTRFITTNSSNTGVIGFIGDKDFYRVSLEAGKTYGFGLVGASLDAVLTLYNASGALLLQQDDDESAAAAEYLSFTAASSGTFFIAASGFETSTGSYELIVTEAADITFGDLDPTVAYTISELSGNTIERSFINIHDGWDALNQNGYMLQTYIHELGHALGLGHAGPYNFDAIWPSSALYDNDSWSATVMSYFDQNQNTSDPNDLAYLTTVMPADIIAIQNLYGTGAAGYQTGNTVWGPGGNVGGTFQTLLNMWGGLIAIDPFVYATNPLAFTIYDTTGTDTLNASVFSMAQVINLNQLTYSNIGGLVGNVVIARGVLIENATGGSGNDKITGNSIGNTLDGYGGNDVLNGLGGADALNGGAGNDTLDGGAGNDSVSFADRTLGVALNPFINTAVIGGTEFDTILNFENFTGSGGNDILQGTFGVNVISGFNGDDLIYAFGGADLVDGGAGADVVAGGAGADTITGGDGGDWLYGEDGNDLVSGTAKNGGAFDVMIGGLGDDTLEGSAGGFDYFYGGAGVNGGTGDGSDSYIVRAGTGIKVMNDFEVGGAADAVRLLGTGYSSFAEVQAAMSFSGVINGTVLVVDAQTQIWFLNGTQPTNLTASDFLYF